MEKKREKLMARHKCNVCGSTYLKLHPRQKCPKCSQKKRLDRAKEYEQKKRNDIKEIKKINNKRVLEKMLPKEHRKSVRQIIEIRIQEIKNKGGKKRLLN